MCKKGSPKGSPFFIYSHNPSTSERGNFRPTPRVLDHGRTYGDTAVEERLTSIEVRLAKLEEAVQARVGDLSSRLDRVEDLLGRLEEKTDRIPWFVLGSWVTIMAVLLGGLYLR